MWSRSSRTAHGRARNRLLVVVTAVVVAMLASALPAAAAPWFTETFSGGESDVFSGFGWRATAEGERGGPGLHTRIPRNSHYGADEHVALSAIGQHDRDEMYWRYWLRLDPEFILDDGDRGKLPGPASLSRTGCRGGNTSTPSSPCWSARMMFTADEHFPSDGKDYLAQDDRALLGTYVYHLDGPAGRGDELMWGRPGRIKPATWYCVEGRVRMNTPGADDGVVQQWLDGNPVLDRRDFQFRRRGEDDLGIRSMWMNVYYGFGSVTSPRAQGISTDSLVLGPERVGCGATPEVAFGDHLGSVHRADIEWLAKTGITRGCNPPDNTSYCPSKAVSRGEMAAFLSRALELPEVSGDRFVDDDGVYEQVIESLAAADITRGCNPPANDRFCPGAPVTRGQMAAFLTRAWGLPKADSTFTDTEGSPFVRDIGALAQAEITLGCNPPDNDRYCPDDPVTREQMASFLRRVSVRPPA